MGEWDEAFRRLDVQSHQADAVPASAPPAEDDDLDAIDPAALYNDPLQEDAYPLFVCKVAFMPNNSSGPGSEALLSLEPGDLVRAKTSKDAPMIYGCLDGKPGVCGWFSKKCVSQAPVEDLLNPDDAAEPFGRQEQPHLPQIPSSLLQ